MDYTKVMQEARKTHASMMKAEQKLFQRVGSEISIDGHTILTSPLSDVPFPEQLRTAMSAIQCGISCDDFQIVAEGQAVLEDLLNQMQKKRK